MTPPLDLETLRIDPARTAARCARVERDRPEGAPPACSLLCGGLAVGGYRFWRYLSRMRGATLRRGDGVEIDAPTHLWCLDCQRHQAWTIRAGLRHRFGLKVLDRTEVRKRDR